jgi:CHAD domain-containing protein
LGKPDKYHLFAAYCFRNILPDFHERVEKARMGKAGNNSAHQMRVASRQLRSLLFNFKENYPAKTARVIQQEIKIFADILGPYREKILLENQLTDILETDCPANIKPGVQLLINDVHKQYKRLKKLVPGAADRMATSQGMAALRKISFREKELPGFEKVCRSPKLMRKAQEDIQRWIRIIFRDEISLANEIPTERFHQMRINMKYLRYTLQDYACLHKNGFRRQLEKLVALQDLMGDIHDLQVWEEHVIATTHNLRAKYGEDDPRSCDVQKASEYLTTEWQNKCMDEYRKFIIQWYQIKNEGYWRKLKLKTK